MQGANEDEVATNRRSLDYFRSSLKQSLNPTTALVVVTNIIWIVTASYCTKLYSEVDRKKTQDFALGSLAFSFFYSIVSFLEIFRDITWSRLIVLFEVLHSAVSIPALSTAIWFKHNVAQKEIIYAHMAIGLIPTYIYLMHDYVRRDLLDFNVAVNTLSLIFVGFMYQNIYAIGCAISNFILYYAFCDFSVHPISQQGYNCCMILLTYCTFMSVL